MNTQEMIPRFRRVANIAVCIVLAFVTCAIYFRRSPISRSASWEPMAGLILSSGRAEMNEDLVPRSGDIPMIIHQTWRTGEIPELFLPWITSWVDKNPKWEYWFWSDEDIKEFLAVKYPQYLDLYESYPATGYRVDTFRYFVLYEYGGVYADIDIEAIRPLDEYTINVPGSCFLSQEPVEHAHFLSPVGIPLVSNALMGCSPGHPFFADVIRTLPSRTGIYHWTDVLHATGPYMLTAVYRGYTSSSVFSPSDDDMHIHLAEPDLFQPTIDDSMVDEMRKRCMEGRSRYSLFGDQSKIERQLCPNIFGYTFNGKPKETSYTNHHWTHTWSGKRNDPWGVFNKAGKTFSLKEELLKYKKPMVWIPA